MFSFLKRILEKKIIYTYNHTLGYMPEKLSEQEQDMIINTAPVFIKILKNKLMVIAIFGLNNSTEKEMYKSQGKKELLTELISYLTHYRESVENEADNMPVDWQNF